MSSKGYQAPIVRFLGEDAGRGGPFALLGLTHVIGSDEVINRAVQSRLRQIDCHPHRSTPDANEVRLAIHSAASQLRDPTLREHLIERWPEGTPIDLPKAWAPKRAAHKLTPVLMRRARMIVGSSGGWNTIARRRLAHLARVNRLGALEIVRALGGGQQGTSKQTGARAQGEAPPRLPNAPTGSGGWYGAYAILALLACGLIVTVLIQPEQGLEQVATEPAELNDTGSSALADGQSAPITAQRDRLTHYTAIAHELDRLVARASTEPEAAIERFGTVYPLFVEQWTSFPLDALQRATVNIAEFIVRLENTGIGSDRLTPLLATPSTTPDREMIVAGVLDVTLASPRLTTDARASLRVLRQRLSDAPVVPRDQVRTSIIGTARHLSSQHEDDDPAWWGAWLKGVDHVAAVDQKERDGLIIDALSSRLQDPAAPGEQWLELASMLVRDLGWQRGSDERFWMLAQFGDDQASTARLAMLTEALVSASAAEGVDARMVLPRDANDPQRLQMAQAYEDAWFGDSAGGDESTPQNSELLNQLRIAITRLDQRIDDERALHEIMTLTACSTAADLFSQGSVQMSEELLQNPPTLKASAPISLDASLQADPEDNDWAERAVNCESAAQLRPLIDQLLSRDQIGINSAYALVHLAIREPELELRELAISQLTRSNEQLGVLIAIDHALSDQRVSSRLDDLVRAVLDTNLPNRNDPDWFTIARRSVLAQIADALARARAMRFNDLQKEIDTMLALRLQTRGLDTNSEEDRPDVLLNMLNQQQRLAMQTSGTRFERIEAELRKIDTRAIVLRARAQSPLQRYLIELEYELNRRRIEIDARFPGISSTLQNIERERIVRMEGSGTILQQIAHTQRAIAQLWVIEIERGGAS